MPLNSSGPSRTTGNGEVSFGILRAFFFFCAYKLRHKTNPPSVAPNKVATAAARVLCLDISNVQQLPART